MSKELDLFVRPDEDISTLPTPKFNADEAKLSFSSHVQRWDEGWRPMANPDDPPITVYMVTLPASSGVRHRWTDSMKMEHNDPFTIRTTTFCHDETGVINEWLKEPGNDKTEAGQWILKNAQDLNNSRRYWRAHRKVEHLKQLSYRLKEIQDQIASDKIALNLFILEAREGRFLTGEEKDRVLREFGHEGIK